MTTTPKRVKEDDPVKKPYQRPQLEVYGDIRSVTNAIGMSGAADGGSHANTRTQ